MKTSAISSGSSGNCFYVENEKEAILVDAGISAKKIIERIESINCKPQKIKALFLTHEHIDYIRGADVLARHLGIPIYATKGTIKKGTVCSDEKLINTIKKNEKVKIGNLEIEAFPKSHSAAEPVSFGISSSKNGKRISVITDLGYLCKNVISEVEQSNLLFLESNHDVNMLETGPYPSFLKAWVKSDEGHLSNAQAGLGILEYANPRLREIVLSHLSLTNNTPQIALRTFNSLIKERKEFSARVSISAKEKPTELFKI